MQGSLLLVGLIDCLGGVAESKSSSPTAGATSTTAIPKPEVAGPASKRRCSNSATGPSPPTWPTRKPPPRPPSRQHWSLEALLLSPTATCQYYLILSCSIRPPHTCLTPADDGHHLHQQLRACFAYYHHRRPRQSLRGQTPALVFAQPSFIQA